MTNFTIHTKETAPKESLAVLETTEKAYGFLPNLIGVLAESPAGVKGYRTLMDIFDESSFMSSSGAFSLTNIFVSKSSPADNPRCSWFGLA